MPVHHIPVEDLTDLVDELERTGSEHLSFIVHHPINVGLLLVVTRPATEQLETRGASISASSAVARGGAVRPS